mmetsp:Transcript_88604/g.235822  ORF Transcript_88604/g.235822 Transcript_88604/m.235822 type:complete len:469 (+) Transcript_88604:155-1561(+)
MVPVDFELPLNTSVENRMVGADSAIVTSPRCGQGQRICISALCRSPMTPRSAAFPVFGSVASEVSETFALRLKNLIDPEEDTANSYPFLKIEASNLKYFSVHLVVAAVADGILETNTSPRKGRSILDQLTKNVSKEQNQVVNLVSENHNIPLKMRVFVKASVEAKALNEYFATCRDQNPAPFVMLSRGLHMVVAYDKSVLDPSDAAVADRFRKQAKTRAVRLVKEAIENPSLNMSSALLRGHVGASRPADLLDPYLESRCVVAPKELEMEAGQGGRCFIFAAKHKKPEQPTPPQQPTPAAAAAAAVTAASMQERDRHSSSDGGDAAPTRGRKRASEEGGSASGCYFPVSLYITAVGDGPLAAGLSDKARERLEAILTKIPKEQQTTVECGGETAQLKLRGGIVSGNDEHRCFESSLVSIIRACPWIVVLSVKHHHCLRSDAWLRLQFLWPTPRTPRRWAITSRSTALR